MIPFLFSPLGRIVVIVVAGLALASGLYLKIRADAIDSVMGEITQETAERVNEAIRNGDAARTDPDRVRDLDKKYCRDC